MRRARPEELQTEATTVLEAHVSEAELARILPVQMVELDVWAEPEPSKGALIQLDNGQYVAVTYGKVTETVQVLLPEGSDLAAGIEAFLSEVPLNPDTIFWRREAVPAVSR